MISEELLQELKRITEEEERILKGQQWIEKELYMSAAGDPEIQKRDCTERDCPKSDCQKNTCRESGCPKSDCQKKDCRGTVNSQSEAYQIDAAKLLDHGKLIQVRPHTRFIHFPRHTHNYIEVVYMCAGTTRHIVNGEEVILQEGELLFLNQKAEQEIYPAGEEDIAVNFIILPEFFDYTLRMLGKEESLLRDFVIDCLRGEHEMGGYLHFRVRDILPVQNLIENLIWTIWNKQPNRRSINQATMGLLFLQLLNYTDRMEVNTANRDQKLTIEVLGYIEEHYRDGELTLLAKSLNYDKYWLSREIKKITGRNYTELVQEKRLNQAAYLLQHTTLSVLEIAGMTGYENISFFHRIFQKKFGMTPRKYRLNRKGV